MFEQYLAQLKHSDPARRREAIVWLGKAGDARALKALGEVYKTDPDPAIRELALKAGRYIQSQRSQTAEPPPAAEGVAPQAIIMEPDQPLIQESPQESQMPDILAAYRRQPGTASSSSAKPSAPPPAVIETSSQDSGGRLPGILSGYTKAPAESGSSQSAAGEGKPGDKPGGPGRELSVLSANPGKVQQAKARLNAAFAAKTRGDDDAAILELARAVQTNPALLEDGAARNLAVALVGGSGRDSLELVVQKSQEKGKLKRKGPGYDTEIWDMAISAVVFFAISAIFSFALFYALIIITAQLMGSMVGMGISPSEFNDLFVQFPFKEVIGEILRLAAITLGSSFFQFMIIYLVGTMMMGGDGSFITFARVNLNVASLTFVLTGVGLGLIIYGAVSGSRAAMDSFGGIGLLMLVLGTLGGLVLQSWMVARIQHFSIFKGVGSVILGSIAAGIIANLLGMFNVNP